MCIRFPKMSTRRSCRLGKWWQF